MQPFNITSFENCERFLFFMQFERTYWLSLHGALTHVFI